MSVYCEHPTINKNKIMEFRKLILLLMLVVLSKSAFTQKFEKNTTEVNGIKVGAMVKNFSATGINNKVFNLEEQLEKGPVVIMFFRGQWCPVCNKYLSRVQDSLELILGKGASLIAISPELPEKLEITKSKTKAEFILLHDKDYHIAKQFDVLFKPDRSTRIIYNTALGANLDEAHGAEEVLLPVPATFIIGKDSKVKWRQFNHDYNKRASIKEILTHL